jgi:hypothetical protein
MPTLSESKRTGQRGIEKRTRAQGLWRQTLALSVVAAGGLAGAVLTPIAVAVLSTPVWQKTPPYTNCVQGFSSLDYPTWALGGYVEFSVTNYSTNSGAGCGALWGRPAGALSIQHELFKWNGSAWYRCNITATYTNAASANKKEAGINYGASSRCSSGWYGSNAYLYANASSTWHGGTAYSGQAFTPN